MKLRIVFMGTPDFAVASLKALNMANAEIVGVITAPDRPKGRGKQVSESAVKTYSKAAGFHILQPTNLKDPQFIQDLRDLHADLQVVVAFRMLPEIVWSMPPRGTFNLHASLLPSYRGAAPINWAVINGEKETGVTTFFLKHEIDTGHILFQEKTGIGETETAGSVHDRLMTMGAELVVKTVEAIQSDSISPQPQSEPDQSKHAPKIFKEDCRIDWNRSSRDVFNFIRGLAPYPAAWCDFHDSSIKVFDATISERKLKAGSFTKEKNRLLAGSADGAIEILELQIQGKRRMKTREFLMGYRWPDDAY